jgi:hypothetical protein
VDVFFIFTKETTFYVMHANWKTRQLLVKTNKTQERGGGARSKRTDTTYPQRPESIRRFITESLYGIIPNSTLEKQK